MRVSYFLCAVCVCVFARACAHIKVQNHPVAIAYMLFTSLVPRAGHESSYLQGCAISADSYYHRFLIA